MSGDGGFGDALTADLDIKLSRQHLFSINILSSFQGIERSDILGFVRLFLKRCHWVDF